jgi:uncharacterized protein (TIGR02145 family)
MKTIVTLLLILSGCNLAFSQDTLYIYKSGSVVTKHAVTDIDSVIFYNADKETDIRDTVNTEGTVTDIDGNVYHTVTIGKQIWMDENLKTTRYSNGEPVAKITDATAWGNLTTAAFCIYDNVENNSATYGRIYNWFAVTDSRKLCPTGWHVPSNDEWAILTTYLGGESVAGGKLKETGTAHWKSPNAGATNETGFTALPGGHRSNNGNYNDFGDDGYWWSSTDDGKDNAWNRDIDFKSADMFRDDAGKNRGFSVRCLKD